MELLDAQLPDSLQRAFDRCVGAHRLSSDAQHDLARIVDRAFAEGNRSGIERSREVVRTSFDAAGIHSPQYLAAVEQNNTDKAIAARESDPTRFRRP
jgi:hypothetical protein